MPDALNVGEKVRIQADSLDEIGDAIGHYENEGFQLYEFWRDGSGACVAIMEKFDDR